MSPEPGSYVVSHPPTTQGRGSHSPRQMLQFGSHNGSPDGGSPRRTHQHGVHNGSPDGGSPRQMHHLGVHNSSSNCGSPCRMHQLGDSPDRCAQRLVPVATIAPPQIGLEQMLSALSRRTAAELRRAEKERIDHARRLEAIEQLCWQHLGGVDTRLGQARNETSIGMDIPTHQVVARLEQDLQQVSEISRKECSDTRCLVENMSDVLRTVLRRVDADHDDLQSLGMWKSNVEQRIASCEDGLAKMAQNTVALTKSCIEDNAVGSFEDRLESALARERKQAHERLHSSCIELTSHLNDLRQELVEQRCILQQSTETHESWRERLQQELAGHLADLETQIAEIGGALASRLQAKITSMTRALNERIDGLSEHSSMQHSSTPPRPTHSLGTLEDRIAALETSNDWLGDQLRLWRKENAELHGSVASLQDPAQHGSEKLLEVAREEAHMVHLEVMSIHARLSAVEDRVNCDAVPFWNETLLGSARAGGG